MDYNALLLEEIDKNIVAISKAKKLEDKLVYSKILKNLSETMKNIVTTITEYNDLAENLDYFDEFDEDEYGDNGNGG